MTNRLELHEKLCDILGSRNVYFQPPTKLTMKYPAIVYNLSNIENKFANNVVYNQSYSYEVTVIDSDPDSEIVHKVSSLPKTRFSRHFTSDNLNHYTFVIYY